MILVTMLLILRSPFSTIQTVDTIEKPNRPSVIRVNTDDGGSFSHGTGTCVAWTLDYGLILSAWHVVQDNRGQITVDYWYPGENAPERINATLVATSRKWDLAALVVKRPLYGPSLIPRSSRYPFIRIARKRPRLGDSITIAGYDGGGTPATYKEATGIVKGFFRPLRSSAADWMMIDAGARSGDSGGPMLNAQGLLGGVLFGTDKTGAHGTHCERIRLFLQEQVEQKYPKLIRRALNPFILYGDPNNPNNPENTSRKP